MSRDLLVRSLAHRLQEQRWGGLKPALARQLKQVGVAGGKDARSITPAATRPKAGTRLIRQWHGTTHEVLVTDGGFEWKGRTWKSLSRIAREITGQKWSGPVFFGLKARSGGSVIAGRLRELTGMSKTPVRQCAIYTRKSSEEGLEQEFNSLDAQREACAAYINSQRHEGWNEISSRYDDGGVSGGTLERPALARLMQDIEAGQVHIVVVYKIDRLTRSLFDFAKLVELFDRHGVSFVSVTQQFNTTTSMGRLTLNVLLSFAQFEREVTGERIRDKIAASRAKGMWMGGNPSLGYDIRDRRLVVNEEEAAQVRYIFRRYLELKSASKLLEDLKQQGICSKRWTSAAGPAAWWISLCPRAALSPAQEPHLPGRGHAQGQELSRRA
jgi:DNA invertase Pin-like site-specific DNA recombinase